MGDVTLLPCPMCAGRAKWDARTKRVWCFGCGLSSRLDEKAPAIAAWNERPAPALTPKQAAADEMFAKLDKIAKWLESLAVISEKQIETCRFESLNGAYRADAKNYKATARDIRSTLAKAGQP